MSFVNVEYPFELKHKQSEFDLTSENYFFKYEYGVNGFSTSMVTSRDTFTQWYNTCNPEVRFFYELLPHNRMIREYYDIDIAGTFSPEQLETQSMEVISSLLDIRNRIANIKCSPKDFIILEDNRVNKLSLHLISKKTYYKSNHIQKKFVECLNNLLISYNAGFTLDSSVYYKNKLFRLYKSAKRKYGSPLKLFKPNYYSFAQMNDTYLLVDSSIGLEEMHLTNDEGEQKEYDYKIPDDSEFKEEHIAILKEWLNEHPEFEIKENRLNRVARTCCFIDENDTHSTENAFWYVRNNRVYVGCFTHTTSICINKENCEEIKLLPTEFEHATHKVEYLGKLSNYGTFNTILMKIPFAGGKTTRSMDYAVEYFERILVISHRITLIQDMSRRFGFASYIDNDFSSDKLVCCINSLPKLTEPNKYDIIIVDELHSCLRQTTMKSQDMRLATSFFIRMIQDTSKVFIGMDGNLSNTDVDFIKSVRQDENMIVLHSTKENNKVVYMYQHRDDVEDIILTNMRKGKKVCVGFSTSVQSIKTFVKRAEFTNKKVLIIHKDNRTKDVLNPEYWLQYDIVFYSPTISEGFSFELEYFDVVCMLMTSMSCPPESVTQMVARIRDAKEIYIHIQLVKSNVKLYRDEEEIYSYYQKNIRELQQVSNLNIQGVDENFQPHIQKDMFWNLFVKNKLELGHDCNNFLYMVYQFLVDNGYRIFQYNEIFSNADTIKENQKIRTECKQQVKYHEENCILKAPDIKPRDIPILEGKVNKTEQDTFILTKAEYKQILNVEPLERQHFSYKSHLNHIRRLKNLIVLYRTINDPHKIDKTSIDDIIEKNATNQITALNKNSFDEQQDVLTNELWIRVKFLNKWCRDLGFRELLSDDEVKVDHYENRLQTLTQRYRRDKKEWNYVQLLFNQKRGISDWIEFLKKPNKFVLQKFHNVLGLDIVMLGDVVIQRLKYKVKLLRNDENTPCIMPYILPRNHTEVTRLEEFFDRTTTYCDVCQKDLGHLINQKHLISKGHVAMIRGTYCEVCDKHFPNGITEKHSQTQRHIRKLNLNS